MDKLIESFTRLPAKNKAGFIFGIAALIALVAGSFLWGRTPDYKVLYSNLTDRDGGAIVAALGQMNVPYKYTEGGAAILVPAEMVHDARLKLASQGLPKGSTVGFEVLESQKLGTTQFQEQINYQRGLEGELARSIQSLSAVQAARIHLAMPKSSMFLREQQSPTASVLLTLHPGRTLDRAQIAGIVHLVASSVPQMSTKGVSVLDQSGSLLSSPGSAMNLDPEQLNYVRELEAGYIKRVQDILEPVVGRGNVRVQVTAEVDFSQSEATAETYKPNPAPDQAAIRTQTTSESGTGGALQAQGVPGAASNQPGAQAAAAAPAGANNKRDSAVSYEVDKTLRHTRTPNGAVKRLSGAVVINHRRNVAADGKVSFTPIEKEMMEKLSGLAREAMGYNETRGDTINVTDAAFSTAEPEVVPELPIWQQPENISLAKDLGKALGGAALVLYILFGLVRPLVRQLSTPPAPPEFTQEALPAMAGAAAGPAGGESGDYAVALSDGASASGQRLSQARDLASQDPRIVATVVRNWVNKE